jgi:hypothetical protein
MGVDNTMSTHANPLVTTCKLVPPQLGTLDAAVSRAGRRAAAVAACTDLERWLDENPLEVRPSVAPEPSAALPAVDWFARLSLLTTRSRLSEVIVAEDEPLLDGALARTDEIAWALVLSAQHIAAECENEVRFAALRHAANALLAIETTARRALASTTLEVLTGDRASRAVREALVVVAFAEKLTDSPTSLRAIAVAAMAQAFLDGFARDRVIELLRAEIARDSSSMVEVVTAYEALCIRRGCGLDDSPVHARLVALACEDARLSLIEGRPSALTIEVGLHELVEEEEPFELVDERQLRSSWGLPPTSAASGTSTLAKIPLAHVVATARARQLSATVVLTDPRGGRHAIVLKDGNLDAVHTRKTSAANEVVARLAAMAALPDDTEIAFFWGRDLLDGREERSQRPAAEVLLAIARNWDPVRMRAEIEHLAAALVVHATIDALSPTDNERCLLIRWNAASRGGRPINVRLLTGDIALPVAYTLMHLGEAHPVGHRCRTCKRALGG